MGNPTTVTPFSYLSVGADGTVYAVDKIQRVWRWNGTVWQEPNTTIRLTQVAVGTAQHVWGINAAQEIFQLVGTQWTRPEPQFARAVQISVGGDGSVWCVNAAGEIFQRLGNAWVQPEPKAARATQVAVGKADVVWCANAQNFVFQRASVGGTFNWIQGDPNLARAKYVTAASDGTVWIVKPDGQLWQYWNGQWIHPEPRNARGNIVSVGSGNFIWYLDANGIPYRRVGSNQWQAIALPVPTPPQPPPVPDFIYTVQPGDTLAGIGSLFGVAANVIMGANGIANPNMIVVNQKLKIPGLPPLQITPDMPTYTIQYGETLGAIATRFGVNLGTLLRLNNVSDPRTVPAGQVIYFPKGTGTPPIYGGGTPLPGYFTYIVQPGDAVSLIAQRFGTSVEAITRANSLPNPNFIVVGQVLYVPYSGNTPTGPINPGNYRTYVVQAGDSLANIAARFAVTVEAVMRANNLPNQNWLTVGQTLLIPSTGSTPTGPINPGGSTTYVIQTGDTLASIATRFGVTTQALMRVNNLPSETWIRVGQVLNIPPRGTTTTTTPVTNPLVGGGGGQKYVVQAGDSVAAIAQKFNVTTQALMQANGLTSPNFLIVGQVLTIPAATMPPPVTEQPTTPAQPSQPTIPTSPVQPAKPPSTGTRQYTVQRGDTLQAIAQKFGVPMETIMKRNNLIVPTAIKIGQVLVIP